jgi:hypothetical protein
MAWGIGRDYGASPMNAEETRDSSPGAAPGSETDFGFRRVPEEEKAPLVRAVFESVAGRYDLMNDLMSAGIHRWWKSEMVVWLNPRPGQCLLDVAGGTGDVACRALPRPHPASLAASSGCAATRRPCPLPTARSTSIRSPSGCETSPISTARWRRRAGC